MSPDCLFGDSDFFLIVRIELGQHQIEEGGEGIDFEDGSENRRIESLYRAIFGFFVVAHLTGGADKQLANFQPFLNDILLVNGGLNSFK